VRSDRGATGETSPAPTEGRARWGHVSADDPDRVTPIPQPSHSRQRRTPTRTGNLRRGLTLLCPGEQQRAHTRANAHHNTHTRRSRTGAPPLRRLWSSELRSRSAPPVRGASTLVYALRSPTSTLRPSPTQPRATHDRTEDATRHRAEPSAQRTPKFHQTERNNSPTTRAPYPAGVIREGFSRCAGAGAIGGMRRDGRRLARALPTVPLVRAIRNGWPGRAVHLAVDRRGGLVAGGGRNAWHRGLAAPWGGAGWGPPRRLPRWAKSTERIFEKFSCFSVDFPGRMLWYAAAKDS
jgi:hypothetical protein